ncbi:MAG: MFS transporter [Candidatus Saccharimonadales bacterium]
MFKRLDNYKRLIISQFLLGMMFFYGIEQLFISNVLGDAVARGPITIAFTVGVLVFDIPTGILADKFGRKLCLLLGCGVGVASLLTLASSHSVAVYVVGALLYGLFISFHNGALEAALYDWLAGQKNSHKYAQYQGSIWAAYLLGAGVANATSGLLATVFSLRATYLFSVVPVVLAGLLLTGLTEPSRHKATGQRGSIQAVIRLIIGRPRIIAFGLQFMAAEIVFLTMGEFGQLYILSFGVGTILLGILWSIDAAFAAGGRLWAYRVQHRPRLVVLLYCAVIGLFALVRHEVGIGLFFIVYGLTEMLENIAETEIQHETPTDIRATVLSAVSFTGNLLGVPVLVLYTSVVRHDGLFRGNEMIALGSILVLLATLLVRPPRIRRTTQQGTTNAPTIIV